MKDLIVVLFLVATCRGVAHSQSQTSPASETSPPAVNAQAEPTAELHGDIYAALWGEVERLRLAHDKLKADNIAEIDKLLRSKRCQIYRVNGLVERALAAMHEYMDAARKYYEFWDVAEQKRVEMLRKSLMQMEVDKTRLEMTMEDEKKDHESLEQRENYLEQSTRTDEIRKQMDDLKGSIRESEDKLTKAQEQFEAIRIRMNTTNAVLTEHLVGIRQNLSRLEVFGQDQTADYEEKRKAAHEVCDTNQPRTSPAKRLAKP
jgi:chromosome segregation ATPase